MFPSIATRLLSSLAGAALLALPAAAQGEPPPARRDEARDARSVRERWESLSQEEQRKVIEGYERWKELSQDDRALMRQRFERLEAERRRALEQIEGDDRRRFEKLRDPERRSELTRRAKAAVRERFERLPPDLRRRIERELEPLPPAERERRVRQFLKPHVEREIRERLGRKVSSGELPSEAVEKLRREAAEKEGDPRARLELLRRFLVEHPDAFRLSPEARDRVRDERDPGSALRRLDRLRRGPPRDDPRDDPRPRPPRPGRDDDRPRRDGVRPRDA